MHRRWYVAAVGTFCVPSVLARDDQLEETMSEPAPVDGPSGGHDNERENQETSEHEYTHEQDEQIGETTGDDGPNADGPTVSFRSCRQVALTGQFEDGDTIAANTGFYDEAGFGNTIGEFVLTVGEDVDAPIDGTIVFEIDDEQAVTETDFGVLVTGFDFGDTGSIITGVAGPDAMAPSPDFPNPQAEACLEAIRPADIDPPQRGRPDTDHSDLAHECEDAVRISSDSDSC